MLARWTHRELWTDKRGVSKNSIFGTKYRSSSIPKLIKRMTNKISASRTPARFGPLRRFQKKCREEKATAERPYRKRQYGRDASLCRKHALELC